MADMKKHYREIQKVLWIVLVFELGGRGSQDDFWIYKRLDQYDRRRFPFFVRWHFLI